MLRAYLSCDFERGRPKLREHKYVERAGKDGMEKVLGIGAEVMDLLPISIGMHCSDRQTIETWSAVTRARDVFITGLPNFNTTEAYEKVAYDRLRPCGVVRPDLRMAVSGFRCSGQIVSALQNAGIDSTLKLSRLEGETLEEVRARLQANHRRGSRLVHKIVPDLVKAAQEALALETAQKAFEKIPESRRWYLDPSWFLVSVPELQAAGHFPALTPRQRAYIVRILALDAECPVRQHLIAHHEWWNDDENANALDELAAAAQWYKSHIQLPPFFFLKWSVHGRHVELPPWMDWPLGGEKLKPPTLLRRLREVADLRQLGPDVHFSHLDRYEDPPAEGEHSLRVLRSSHQISRVAKQLRNCARSYISQVKGGYVLVAAFEGEKPTALAGYAGGSEWDHRPVASSNRNVDAGVQAKFDRFLPALVKSATGDDARSSSTPRVELNASDRARVELALGLR